MGFRHGPKSILDERTLVVVYISADPHTRRYDLDLLAELQKSMRRPGSIIAVTAGANTTADKGGVWQFEGLDGVEDPMLALPFVLIAQLLGLYLSLKLGVDGGGTKTALCLVDREGHMVAHAQAP